MWKDIKCFLDSPCVSIGGSASPNSPFFVCMFLLCVSTLQSFMFVRACIAFFPRLKKNKQTANYWKLVGSAGLVVEKEGGREGGTQRRRAATSQPERRRRRRRDVSCASCHAIHLLSIQRDGGPACCLLLPNKVKHNKPRALTLCSARTWTATRAAVPSGFVFFFSVDFFIFVFFPFPASTFWGECVVFLEDRYVIFTDYSAFWLQVDASSMSKTSANQFKLEVHMSVSVP